MYANQVLYGFQAGSKKDFEGFYLCSMRDHENVPRIFSLTRVKQVVLGPKKGSVRP